MRSAPMTARRSPAAAVLMVAAALPSPQRAPPGAAVAEVT
jgi:hypothetical protein